MFVWREQKRGFPSCKQKRCHFAHEGEKLRSVPALRAGDLASLRDEVAKLPGALLPYCVLCFYLLVCTATTGSAQVLQVLYVC